MTIRPCNDQAQAQLLSLYDSVGWTAYTACPEQLHRAVAGSLCCLGAWEGDILTGLVRAVGDGVSVLYGQDLLVRPEYQRRGIDRRLLEAMLDAYPHVRQRLLMTDGTPQTLAFYRALGFVPVGELGCVALQQR